MKIAPEETTITLAYRIHYEDSGALDGWNTARVNRLCRLLHCTVHELAAKYGCFDFKRVNRYMECGAWPPEWGYLFSVCENFFKERLTK